MRPSKCERRPGMMFRRSALPDQQEMEKDRRRCWQMPSGSRRPPYRTSLPPRHFPTRGSSRLLSHSFIFIQHAPGVHRKLLTAPITMSSLPITTRVALMMCNDGTDPGPSPLQEHHKVCQYPMSTVYTQDITRRVRETSSYSVKERSALPKTLHGHGPSTSSCIIRQESKCEWAAGAMIKGCYLPHRR